MKKLLILSFILLNLPLSVISINKFKYLNDLNEKSRIKHICEQYPFAMRFLQKQSETEISCKYLDELVDQAISRTSEDLLLRVLGNPEKQVKDLPIEKPSLDHKGDLHKTVSQLFPDVGNDMYINPKIKEEIDFLKELANKSVEEEIETIKEKYNK